MGIYIEPTDGTPLTEWLRQHGARCSKDDADLIFRDSKLEPYLPVVMYTAPFVCAAVGTDRREWERLSANRGDGREHQYFRVPKPALASLPGLEFVTKQAG